MIEQCTREQADLGQLNSYLTLIQKSDEVIDDLAGVLSIVGNPTRLKIIYLLKQRKEMCPCDLSDVLLMSVPAISQHVRKMKDRNLLCNRREGKTIYYSLNEQESEVTDFVHSLIVQRQDSHK